MSFLLLNTGGGDDLLLNIASSHLLLSADQDLRWEPHFPDRCPPPRRLSTSAQQFLGINVSPIVNPPIPVPLVWQSWYPAQVRRAALPRSSYQAFATGTPFLGTQLRSFVSYPDRFPARRLRPFEQSFEIGGVTNVPIVGGWRPRYPDSLQSRRPVPTGVFSYLTSPTVILNANPCITWHDEALQQSELTEQDLINTGFTPETLTNPDLTGEGLC